MRRMAACLVLLAGLSLVTLPARADSILIGTGGNVVNGAGITPGQFLATSFTLTSSINVSAINVLISGFGSGTMTLQLTNALGAGATSSNLLATLPFTPPSTGGGNNGQWVNLGTGLTLSAGTYYLVISTANTGGGWIGLDTFLPTTVGSVGSSLFTPTGGTNASEPYASTWNTCFGCGAFGFEIVGNTDTSPVPEPGTVVLLGSGLVAVWWRKRRVTS